MVIHRIPTLARGIALALVLAACSDSTSLAPHKSLTTAALPQSARYILRLSNVGPVPSPVAAFIAANGGHVVRAHSGTGLVVVAGLSASAAGQLRQQPGVGVVVADKQRLWIHEPSIVRGVQLNRAPAAGRSPTVHTLSGGPTGAHAYMQGAQWWLTNIGADTAWATTSQGAGQTVYILDTGVDTAHVELKGHINLKLSKSFALVGTTDTVFTWFHDVKGHGTFVSSLVAGNSSEIAAVAPQAKIVMIRVLGDDGTGSDSDILSGLLYAADSGATIISMSLGGYLDRASGFDLLFAEMFQQAVDYAVARGALIVVASGNESLNTNTGMAGALNFVDSLDVPAGLHHLISVGATGPIDLTNFNQIAQYSNFGKSDVAVFAPGGNDTVQTHEQTINFADWIIGACSSAISGGCFAAGEAQYNVGLGTSFATPMVAAEAAVLLGQSGSFSPAALEACILNSATPQGSGKGDINYDFGLISIPSALKTAGC